MSRCAITGIAELRVSIDTDKPTWTRTDPIIHVEAELERDQLAWRELSERYEVGEWCPYQPTSRHARLRADHPLP